MFQKLSRAPAYNSKKQNDQIAMAVAILGVGVLIVITGYSWWMMIMNHTLFPLHTLQYT